MTDRDAAPCYIARTTKPEKNYPIVGTVICASVDEPRMTKDNAKAVAKWIREGLTIERVPAWWVRKYFGTTEVYRGEEREAA